MRRCISASFDSLQPYFRFRLPRSALIRWFGGFQIDCGLWRSTFPKASLLYPLIMAWSGSFLIGSSITSICLAVSIARRLPGRHPRNGIRASVAFNRVIARYGIYLRGAWPVTKRSTVCNAGAAAAERTCWDRLSRSESLSVCSPLPLPQNPAPVMSPRILSSDRTTSKSANTRRRPPQQQVSLNA